MNQPGNGQAKRQSNEDIYVNQYHAGSTVGRIFQFGPGSDEVQVLVL